MPIISMIEYPGALYKFYELYLQEKVCSKDPELASGSFVFSSKLRALLGPLLSEMASFSPPKRHNTAILGLLGFLLVKNSPKGRHMNRRSRD